MLHFAVVVVAAVSLFACLNSIILSFTLHTLSVSPVLKR